MDKKDRENLPSKSQFDENKEEIDKEKTTNQKLYIEERLSDTKSNTFNYGLDDEEEKERGKNKRVLSLLLPGALVVFLLFVLLKLGLFNGLINKRVEFLTESGVKINLSKAWNEIKKESYKDYYDYKDGDDEPEFMAASDDRVIMLFQIQDPNVEDVISGVKKEIKKMTRKGQENLIEDWKEAGASDYLLSYLNRLIIGSTFSQKDNVRFREAVYDSLNVASIAEENGKPNIVNRSIIEIAKDPVNLVEYKEISKNKNQGDFQIFDLIKSRGSIVYSLEIYSNLANFEKNREEFKNIISNVDFSGREDR